jgi:alpha-amylase/alpha-mannosidase (GH57 family)
VKHYICVHGHFYQPPRENPWLEAIEVQDSAYPYHDWNERITAECYRPNAASRILDGERRIVQIVNNYSRMSFNFGPTVLGWIEVNAPDVYRAILDADRDSLERFSGHGSAIAQVYNHMILPLADERDRKTQVLWGVRDFEHRFGRPAEGMWLAETAVDLKALETLVDHGIRFTILSPHQARRVREAGKREWMDVRGARIDPTRPYHQRLPSGRKIALFFYDGPISHGIAFERLLDRGEDFADRLLGAFSDDRDWPQLVHVATDGETFGHHHRHGEMALAYALDLIEEREDVALTNYGDYLARCTELPDVEIIEDSSWSCIHGVERWRGNCGCNTGRPGWHQEWRAPLRAALDWLREAVAPLYEESAGGLLKDPWAARDDYISIVLDRSAENLDRFFEKHGGKDFRPDQHTTALKLLELQRHAMLMYTSCGWFFDDLSGIETVQVIQYAGRVVQLAQELFDAPTVETGFLERLFEARSNIAEHQNGKVIFEKWVKPAHVDLAKVCSQYAAASLFEEYPDEAGIYCYRIERRNQRYSQAGRARMTAGKCQVSSQVTRESALLSFACIHLGDHNVVGGVRHYEGATPYRQMVKDLTEVLSRADIPEAIRRLDRHFVGTRYSLKTLFRDEQRRILEVILDHTLSDAESVYRRLFDQYDPLMHFLSDLGTPIPQPMRTAGEAVLNADLRRAFLEEEIDPDRIRFLIERTRTWQADLDSRGLSYMLQKIIQERSEAVFSEPTDLTALDEFDALISAAQSLPFEIDFSLTQNQCYRFLQKIVPGRDDGSEETELWVSRLKALGEKLSIRVSD